VKSTPKGGLKDLKPYADKESEPCSSPSNGVMACFL